MWRGSISGTKMNSRISASACRMSELTLLKCLQACGVSEIEVHSLIGHGDSVIELILSLRAPLHLVIHDYSWFCPRISLTAGDHRYCGEPAIAACRDCVADHGTNFDGPVSPDELVDRTRRLMKTAHSIIAPSRDSARRIEARFGREVVVAHWEQPRPFALQEICHSGRTVAARADMCCRRDRLRKGLHQSAPVRPDGRSSKDADSSSWWWAIPATTSACLTQGRSALLDDTINLRRSN